MSIGKCECLNPDVKVYIEGSIVHFIRELEEEIKHFKAKAEERKGLPLPIDKIMGEHYIGVASGIERYIENLEKVKAGIKEIPSCEFGVTKGNPHNPRRLTVQEQHQLKIAKDTLKMPDAMVGVMGGMTKEQAREVIKSLERKT